jgi:DNA-binding transcriptional regulator GbsR (MarR family)
LVIFSQYEKLGRKKSWDKMSVEDIKKEFIHNMEEKHSGFLFPKKFFGCMMAVFIEQVPITQDRIEELTNYSKTTISQMLTLIQMKFPLKQIKKPGIRKKYYTIDITTRKFMFSIFMMIIDSYREKVEFMPLLIEEIQPYSLKHPKFDTLKLFLENYYKFSSLYMKLLLETTEELRILVDTGQINTSELSNFNILSSPEHQSKIQLLLNPPNNSKSFTDQQIREPILLEQYNHFKQLFFQKFRENLTYSGSQKAMARAIIGTELLLEQRPLTQKEIEKATNFQRSTISDTLKLLLKIKMIELVKRPGDRKKYYVIVQSWDQRTINQFRRNVFYAIEMKDKINKWLEEAENFEKENSLFNLFLKDIHHTYVQYEHYFRLLEVKYLNHRLKE